MINIQSIFKSNYITLSKFFLSCFKKYLNKNEIIFSFLIKSISYYFIYNYSSFLIKIDFEYTFYNNNNKKI